MQPRGSKLPPPAVKSSTLATGLILPPSKENLLLKKQNWFVLPYKNVMKSLWNDFVCMSFLKLQNSLFGLTVI